MHALCDKLHRAQSSLRHYSQVWRTFPLPKARFESQLPARSGASGELGETLVQCGLHVTWKPTPTALVSLMGRLLKFHFTYFAVQKI
jgi:hypothetical protein